MFFCEKCGDSDCCERTDLPEEPVLCDSCYEYEFNSYRLFCSRILRLFVYAVRALVK